MKSVTNDSSCGRGGRRPSSGKACAHGCCRDGTLACAEPILFVFSDSRPHSPTVVHPSTSNKCSVGSCHCFPGPVKPRNILFVILIFIIVFYSSQKPEMWWSGSPWHVCKCLGHPTLINLGGQSRSVEDGSGLPTRVLRDLCGSARGFCGRVCIVENLLKNPHTEPQRFCRTSEAKPSFPDPENSSPKSQ